MLENIDKAIFYSINHGLSNSSFNFVMPMISETGSGPLLFAAAFILLFFKKRELKALGLILLAGLAISYYMVSGLKVLIARPRPFLVLPDVFLLARNNGMSFPSGHATTAFMAATILTAYFRKYAVIFYLFASAVAVSRVYIGVHYPSDVLAGAVIGIMIGYIVVKAGPRSSIG